MIQRVQSIWLLCAALTILCLLFIPIASKSIGDSVYTFTSAGIFQKTNNTEVKYMDTLPLQIMIVVITGLSILNIFNFKKRTTQKFMVIICVVLTLCMSLMAGWYSKQLPDGMIVDDYKSGSLLPFLTIIFYTLAFKGIQNDERLIKSADRLR